MIAPQSGVEHRLRQHLAGSDVIGVAIGPVWNGNGSRPRSADESGSRRTCSASADPAIGPAQIHAPSRAQDSSRRLRFSQALVDGAVAAHFARGQIAQPDTVTECRVARDSAAGADLDVVGVGAENQQVDRDPVVTTQPDHGSDADNAART